MSLTARLGSWANRFDDIESEVMNSDAARKLTRVISRTSEKIEASTIPTGIRNYDATRRSIIAVCATENDARNGPFARSLRE